MRYRISFTRRATLDLDELYASINAPNSEAAVRWFVELERTIRLLAVTPRMGAVTHQNASRRQLIYGNKPHFYRVIYNIDDSAGIVNILQVRHGKRLPSS